MFNLEFKLRFLVEDDRTYCKVFSAFDCGRMIIENFEGLNEVDLRESEEDDSSEEKEKTSCRYFHI